MKGWAILVTATATEDNPNFVGEVRKYFHLKRGICREANNEPIWADDVYKSKGIAERQMQKEIEDYNYYKKNSNTIYKYWDNEYEVVEVETIG